MMDSTLVSQFYDVGEVLRQNMKLTQLKQQVAERRNTIGASVQRNRNFSVGNFPTVTGPTTMNPSVISMDNQTLPDFTNDHKKLDRSYSEPCDTRTMLNNNTNLNIQQQQQKQTAVNSSRYKTELCRPFEESGHCKYADKCQFAHGNTELKNLSRHPKYKTELCRTFHSKGFCPYGPRCNFVHNEDLRNKSNERNNQLNAQQQQQYAMQQQQQNQQQQPPQATQYFQHISPPSLSQSPPPMLQRPSSINFNSSCNGSLGSTESSPPSSVGSESPSLSPVFFGEDIQQMLNPCYSLPLNNSLNYDNSTNNTVFNISELANMDLTPLNIQTQLNNSNMGLLTQQFNALLNISNTTDNHNNRSSVFDNCWDSVVGAPLSSPDSISGDSVGSASSFSTSNSYSCGSPSEVGKNFRLPVFNHISQD